MSVRKRYSKRGERFALNKYSNDDDYYAKIINLSDIADRMQGVEIYNEKNSMDLLRELRNKYKNSKDEFNGIFIYADPPYLPTPESIVKYKKFYNPGICYTMPWDIGNHLEFLHLVKDAPFRILISGYDDINNYYDFFLKPPKWSKMRIPVVSTISKKTRTEILWWNY